MSALPDAIGEDYVFLPHYENRATAARVFARQFNALLEETGLKMDAILQTERTIYSLRQTAVCMTSALGQDGVPKPESFGVALRPLLGTN